MKTRLFYLSLGMLIASQSLAMMCPRFSVSFPYPKTTINQRDWEITLLPAHGQPLWGKGKKNILVSKKQQSLIADVKASGVDPGWVECIRAAHTDKGRKVSVRYYMKIESKPKHGYKPNPYKTSCLWSAYASGTVRAGSYLNCKKPKK